MSVIEDKGFNLERHVMKGAILSVFWHSFQFLSAPVNVYTKPLSHIDNKKILSFFFFLERLMHENTGFILLAVLPAFAMSRMSRTCNSLGKLWVLTCRLGHKFKMIVGSTSRLWKTWCSRFEGGLDGRLESWPSVSENSLFLNRNPAWFPAPTLGGLQPPELQLQEIWRPLLTATSTYIHVHKLTHQTYRNT